MDEFTALCMITDDNITILIIGKIAIKIA